MRSRFPTAVALRKVGGAESAENRSQDGAFLADMAGFIGRRGMAALERINAALGLDYGGIDFAENGSGNVLLFEANATMLINPPAPEPVWDYRRPSADRALAAARKLLEKMT